MLILFPAEYLFGARHLLLAGCGHVFERIRDAELLPFIDAEGMIGQHLDALHIAERVDEGTQAAQLIIVVGDSRHEHVADPYRHAKVGETTGTVENVLIAMTGELPVRFAVNMLQVKQHRVGTLHQSHELAVEGLATCERLARRVETRVDAALMSFLKERKEPVDLQQRLTATDGDATLVAPVGTVALRLVEQLCDRSRLLFFPCHAPRIGVMAIAAAHVAAFEKDDEADTGTVDRAERLGGVNV